MKRILLTLFAALSMVVGVAGAQTAHADTWPYTGSGTGQWCPTSGCSSYYMAANLGWAYNGSTVRSTPVTTSCTQGGGGSVPNRSGWKFSVTRTYKAYRANSPQQISLYCDWDVYEVDSYGDASYLGSNNFILTGDQLGGWICEAYPTATLGSNQSCGSGNWYAPIRLGSIGVYS